MMTPSTRSHFPIARWLPAALLLGFLGTLAEAKPAKQRDIADTIAANPILTKFAAMLQASGQGTFLSSRGPFTIFVPTDSAFARLPPGMLEMLMRPENNVRLQNIVLFHVVNGKRLTAKDLIPLPSLLSCQGSPLALKTSRTGAQFVLKAKIVHADIRCQNGIIHQIDAVLMPPEASLPPIASPPPPAPETNAPETTPAASTNAAADTNAIPVAPIARPQDVPR